MTELPGKSDVVDVRAWIANAVKARGFELPISAQPPAAQLDGEAFDYRAMVYAVLVELGNGAEIALRRQPDCRS